MWELLGALPQLGIQPLTQGEVLYDGKRIRGKISKELDREVIQKCQMIFQDPMASLGSSTSICIRTRPSA